jgi:hypothetical protein
VIHSADHFSRYLLSPRFYARVSGRGIFNRLRLEGPMLTFIRLFLAALALYCMAMAVYSAIWLD